MNGIIAVSNQYKDKGSTDFFKNFTQESLSEVLKFHESMPGYQQTPLHSLNGLSTHLGVNSILVKDESKRFGLNAFKGLGASYAMIAYFSKKYELDLKTTDFHALKKFVESLPQLTFATATEGNHGKGVAWAAKLLKQQAKIFMPEGASESRLNAIKNLDAEGYIIDLNYDDTVKRVAELSKENNWILLQDTAWDDYEELPLYIMQGYTSIIFEVLNQLENVSLDEITHVFLQAGVGSFAASIAAVINNLTSETSPKIIIVEPSEADCLYRSALDESGDPKRVYGDLNTIMAGLSCGEPNPVAWNILKEVSNYFLSCTDSISAKGMRVLGNPIPKDPKIIGGASGSLSMGVLYELMKNERLESVKRELELNDSSKVLIINTEGDTDPENYREMVWD